MSSFANYTDITGCPNSSLIPVDFSLEPPIMLLYGGAEKILVTYVLPFIVIFGLLSNSAFLFVLVRVRQMRNATNCYLANLAICDTLYLIAAGGEKVLQYIHSPVNGNNLFLGQYGCTIVNSIIYLSYFVSFVVVTLVSLERFYAVKYPLHHRSVTRRKRTIIQVGCSWILGGILSGLYVPAYAQLKQYCIIWPDNEQFKSFPNVIGICGCSKSWMTHLGLALIFSSYMISLVCNVYLYGRIISSLHQRTVSEEQSSLQSNYNHVLQVRNQVARMLIANGVIFFVCQTPYRILSFFGTVLNELIRDAVWYHPAVRICHMLLYLNAAINAVVYTVGSECYRMAFREAFTGKPAKQPGEPTPVLQQVMHKRPSGTSTVI
ncbi:thyrotropin-releasing hormone receptor-like [Amphiura filiformis]|uniref:thyrotropin-releasing hormone receptor-like n=1 Tax=Amphiura filiformis TaxID=82378 RepID=UPI003B21FFBC